jgi:hypothetical protein
MTLELSRSRMGLGPTAPCPTWADRDDWCLALTDPVVQNFCITRGDTGRFMIIVTEHDGVTPIDIISATWDADIRVSFDEDPVAYFEVVPHPGQAHIVDVTLTAQMSQRLGVNAPAGTGEYIYDVEMNKLTVNPDVSRS